MSTYFTKTKINFVSFSFVVLYSSHSQILEHHGPLIDVKIALALTNSINLHCSEEFVMFYRLHFHII